MAPDEHTPAATGPMPDPPGALSQHAPTPRLSAGRERSTSDDGEPPSAEERVDVVVVGGGPAGLSAALVLGRARRSTLLVDAGRPRNASSASMHGYLTQEGASPAAVLDAGRREVRSYGVEIAADEVSEVGRSEDRLVVRTAAGRLVHARRVVVATGLADDLPDIEGVAERWGRDVLYCPYCHGYEVRDQALGSVAEDPDGAVHQALLLRQWSDDVVLFLNSVAPEEIGPEQRELLAARGVGIVHGAVRAVRMTDDRLSGVELEDGRVVPRTVVFVAPQFRVNDALLGSLGTEMEDSDLGRGLVVDGEGRTSAAGVWVAGNLADLSAQVIGAAESGARAAIGINGELCQEDAELARAAARDRASAREGPGHSEGRHRYR